MTPATRIPRGLVMAEFLVVLLKDLSRDLSWAFPMKEIVRSLGVALFAVEEGRKQKIKKKKIRSKKENSKKEERDVGRRGGV